MNLAGLMYQTITYWAPSAPDGYGGQTFVAPVSLTGRWEDKQVNFSTANGDEVVSRAIVFLTQDVELDGYLYLGTSVEATPVADAWMIQKKDAIPSLQNSQSIYEAWL